MMIPFDSYPGNGRVLLGIMRGSNSRHDYCSKFLRLTGQKSCAYCDKELTGTYEAWLSIVLDHVVPVSVCKALNVPVEWAWDYSNTVLACTACNGFCNRYKLESFPENDLSLDDFYNLRDDTFGKRKLLIAARHSKEQEFFTRRPWWSARRFLYQFQ